MFEFWEPTDPNDPTVSGTIQATLSGRDGIFPDGINGEPTGQPFDASEGRDYRKLTRSLVLGIQGVLEGSFDVSGAQPFNNSKYDGSSAYDTVTNFGELALQTFAHYLLGHIGATSAFTNDVSFKRNMLSLDSSDTYNVNYTDVYEPDTMLSVDPGIATDAKLAQSLVNKLVTKLDADIKTIVEQVIGQDASRAMDKDNNGLTPNKRQALKFIPDDVIYMKITLATPNVSVTSGQLVTKETLESKYTQTSYNLKITLTE
jgi:hypothetical protein